MLALFLFALAADPPSAEAPPLPPGHRPYGPLLRSDLIDGWEVLREDVPPLGGRCENIGQPMVQALNPPQRGEAVAMLARKSWVALSEAEAARLIGAQVEPGEPLSATLFKAHLAAMKQQKHSAEVERQGSWSRADQEDFEKLSARFETGEHRAYKPYLARAAVRFGDGHAGAPWMLGDLCGPDLRLSTLTFAFTIPPAVRVPAIAFLPRPPERVISTNTVAW